MDYTKKLKETTDYFINCVKDVPNKISELDIDSCEPVEIILDALCNTLCSCANAAHISKELLIKNLAETWDSIFEKNENKLLN